MAAVFRTVQPRTQSVTVATAPATPAAHGGKAGRFIMALKLITFAVVAGIALAGLATAQTVDPNAAAAPADAPMGSERQLNMRHRQFLPPDTPTTQELHRVCAWRSDGGQVTGRYMRLPLNVSISNCAVSQNRPLGAACRCASHDGSVIEVPV
jgi:hypothetical protein